MFEDVRRCSKVIDVSEKKAKDVIKCDLRPEFLRSLLQLFYVSGAFHFDRGLLAPEHSTAHQSAGMLRSPVLVVRLAVLWSHVLQSISRKRNDVYEM